MKNAILAHLSSQYPWADRLTVLPETDSTNDQLKALARQGAPAGTALIADRQTGGHGRMGRSFLSPPGVGIYLSILLRPDCLPIELMHLTCAAAVAMCDAVEAAAGFRPGIKWTNDLVCEKRKLGGILTELGFTPQGRVDWAIIGIGLNCCQSLSDFDPSIRDMAGSLVMVTGKPVCREAIAAAMLESLSRMDGILLTEKSTLMNRYRRDCITLGQEVSILSPTGVRRGNALDIDESGALTVVFSDGHTESVSSGEVSVRGMYGYL